MGLIPHPTQIRYLEDEDVLKMTFSDDLEVDYPTALLRGFCPCAHCQGHGGGPPTWTPPRTVAAKRVEDVTQVGNYAVCVHWGDGHDTGIYSFQYLRRLDIPDDFDPEQMEQGSEVPLK